MMDQSTSENTNTKKKKKECLSMIEQLPTHIIIDILTWLPIKTLIHCRLVCKEWRSLTSSPHFAHLHLSRSPISLLLQSYYRFRESKLLRLIDLHRLRHSRRRETQLKFAPKINFPRHAKETVNSCNGLLCFYDDSDPVFVCNPILGEYITLPLSPQPEGGSYRDSISALGFSRKTNQYKVVQIYLQKVTVNYNPIASFETYRDEGVAEIYTIGEGCWRNIGRVPYHLPNHTFNTSVNGAIHWLTFARDSSDFIRCFDFESEKMRVVEEPPEFGTHKKDFPNLISLGVLRDRLSICDFSSPVQVDIWILRDYGIKESWSKEFVIGNVISKGRHRNCYEPIMILKSGEILMLFNEESLVLYDPKLCSFEHLKIYGVNTETGFHGTAHTPSLVSLTDVAKGERLTRLI